MGELKAEMVLLMTFSFNLELWATVPQSFVTNDIEGEGI